MLCGHLHLKHATANPILAGLPATLVWRADSDERSGALARLILLEAVSASAESEAILDRLVEALFIHIVTANAGGDSHLTRLSAAVADKRIAEALNEIHAHPENAWSLTELASRATMSRSAFAARFPEMLGLSPMTYVTNHRMNLARIWLTEERAPIAVVASRCGYENESSFSKAFRKTVGVAPGSLRRATPVSA